MDTKEDKIQRILDLYTRLMNGDTINKKQEASRLGISERSVQRDLDDIREFLSSRTIYKGVVNDVVYDRSEHGYQLKQVEKERMSDGELLAVMKILLESRAFIKPEMMKILDKLIDRCALPENRKLMKELCANECFHYVELRHKKVFTDKMWEIALAAKEHRCIEILYEKAGTGKVVTRKVEPLAILFCEFYFYMAAQIENINRDKEFQIADDPFPTIYRIDRIRRLKILDEHFQVPYKDRFEEGEYRKRVQFMYGGKLQKIEFWYKGWSLEAVLDKLPTAKIIQEDKENNRYLIRAETFGKGINMWLKSQGENIEVVKRH
ncbi:MAG: WYL domain-containing protein [Eubacterium sp.]|nr:WYL domain-containing protein [Eubacterium sp.]